jgi:hypothetical protein
MSCFIPCMLPSNCSHFLCVPHMVGSWDSIGKETEPNPSSCISQENYSELFSRVVSENILIISPCCGRISWLPFVKTMSSICHAHTSGLQPSLISRALACSYLALSPLPKSLGYTRRTGRNKEIGSFFGSRNH